MIWKNWTEVALEELIVQVCLIKFYYKYNLTCRVQFHIVLVTEVNGMSLEPSENEQLTTHDDSGVVMNEAGQSNHHSEGEEYYHVFMFRLYCT